jgi:hypothetical protein
VVVVVVEAQEVFYVSPDLRKSDLRKPELRKSGSVCIDIYIAVDSFTFQQGLCFNFILFV